MSESETLEQEVETVETNAVEELINQITAGELNKAEGSFKSIIDDKMADALEAQRIATALVKSSMETKKSLTKIL